jgi:hypothetical protein
MQSPAFSSRWPRSRKLEVPRLGANVDRYCPGNDHTLARVSVGAAVGLGAVLGLALGIVVSLTTDVPFAPEARLVLGALLGWLSHRRLVS